jgi:nucleoside phosphorylase
MEKPRLLMEDFKIGWLSALPVELAAAIAVLDQKYLEVPLGMKRSNLYTLGRIGRHKIVIACVPDSLSSKMSTAAVAYEVRRMFPCIRFWLMVGTGGNVPQNETALRVSHVRIGDVVISDLNMQDRGVTQYDLGKTDSSGRYVKIGSLKKPPAVLLDALLKLQAYDLEGPRRGWVHLGSGYSDSLRRFDELWWTAPALLRASNFRFDPIHGSIFKHFLTPKSTWKEVALKYHLPRIHFGRIASVNHALIERAPRERLSFEFGDIHCFDTEAFGLIAEFPCLIIRGIHDYAVSHILSNDQPYAAAAAAVCAKKYLKLIPPADVAETPIPGNVTATSNCDPGTPIGKLKKIKLPEEPNIIILGETGVGKATFINAFVNYLQYETLDDSIRAKSLHWVVPHAFALQYVDISTPNGQIVSKKIRVGPTTDQRDGTGQHLGTQIINTEVSSIKSHLIDTPSIGGASSMEQDRQNIASIMSTLATFDKLHGVLILLKANQSCLSDTFRRYMNEFFTRFHKDAAKNIVFGLTHSRPFKYEPGVTIKLLREMLYQYEGTGVTLDKNRFYCFDSESFLFLAAQHNGVSIGSAEGFTVSWQQSAKEVRRLLQHFQSREPHVVKLSINLNASRLSVL